MSGAHVPTDPSITIADAEDLYAKINARFEELPPLHLRGVEPFLHAFAAHVAGTGDVKAVLKTYSRAAAAFSVFEKKSSKKIRETSAHAPTGANTIATRVTESSTQLHLSPRANARAIVETTSTLVERNVPSPEHEGHEAIVDVTVDPPMTPTFGSSLKPRAKELKPAVPESAQTDVLVPATASPILEPASTTDETSNWSPEQREQSRLIGEMKAAAERDLVLAAPPGTGEVIVTPTESATALEPERDANGVPLYHPACLAFPEPTECEMGELTESVRVHGVQQEGVLLNGKVLDGRCREIACRRAGVPMRWRELPAGIDPVDYVTAANKTHRRLTPGQLAMAAAALVPLISEAARERQRAGRGLDGSGGRGNKTLAPAGAKVRAPKAAAVAATMVGAKARNVERAMVVQQHGAPETIAAARAGTLPLSTAEQISQLPPQDQVKAIEAGPEAARTTTKRLCTNTTPAPTDSTENTTMRAAAQLEPGTVVRVTFTTRQAKVLAEILDGGTPALPELAELRGLIVAACTLARAGGGGR